MSQEEEIIVPEMIGFEILTKIIIGYLKVGAEKEPKSSKEVAAVANVGVTNVGLNAKFLKSIDIVEGKRGRYKLTSIGKEYAQALDWGKLDEANKLLNGILKDKILTDRTLGFVDINKPVENEDLVSQIALIAGKNKEARFVTGIRGFVDMLVTSGLLEEDSEGRLAPAKTPSQKPSDVKPSDEEEFLPRRKEIAFRKEAGYKPAILPISLNLNIDNELDIEHFKKMLKAIKEVLSEE